ncbi:expressed unknown protein [Seminavis robusta]|uniref:Uncharacterized protein n=1 Tax=Seminavis robusta TaxID=568900 RepID=A0A9N8D9N5_9STRA|nr:expressed unknown protein [Seminavis robusta]|eukprot:Sro54_g031860.1 n/a (373) ;mRNA; r:65465-66583
MHRNRGSALKVISLLAGLGVIVFLLDQTLTPPPSSRSVSTDGTNRTVNLAGLVATIDFLQNELVLKQKALDKATKELENMRGKSKTQSNKQVAVADTPEEDSEDDDGEIRTLYFVHYQKVGSSLLTLLRNRIPSCTLKDWTCFGTHGGGVDAFMAKDGKDHFPFTVKSMNLTHLTRNERIELENCNGKFHNCQERVFHCSYKKCKHYKNKVTMFRNPHKWFNSYLDFVWLYFAAQKKPLMRMYGNRSLGIYTPKQQQIDFTTGTKNVTRAMEVLRDDYVFWGITDHWSTTVCLFHCELGGETRPSELANTRSLDKHPFKTAEDIPKNITRPDQVLKNRTDWVEKHLKNDLDLFHNHLMPQFKARAKRCKCKL